MKREILKALLICFFYSAHSAALPLDFMLRNHVLDTQNSRIVHCFSHGLGATQNQGLRLLSRIRTKYCEDEYRFNEHWIMQDPLALFNFADAKSDFPNEFYKSEVNLGQEKDMKRLSCACDTITQTLPECEGIVLVGISRGATTSFNYAAMSNNPYIKALVLESPPDSLNAVVKHLLRRYKVHWIPFSYKIGMKIAQKQFPSLNKDGIFPIKVAHRIPKDMPIIFIHPKNDRVVPVYCSRNLYVTLRESGHEHVYLFELESGEHGKAIHGNQGKHYTYVVHAFYKKYNLPHDEAYAEKGTQLLVKAQPSVATVKELLKKRKYRSINEEIDDEDDFDLLYDDEHTEEDEID